MAEEAVWEAEQELRLAQLTEEYNGVLDEVHAAPGDEGALARKAELSSQIVDVRRGLREKREGEALALSDGEGVAQPAPVESQTGVNE